jgi:hypothetical protein
MRIVGEWFLCFDVIFSRRHDEVLLLAPAHRYVVSPA